MKKRTEFRIALAMASEQGERYTATDFANDHNVSTTMLHEVIRGETTSARLQEAIDQFITAQMQEVKRHLEQQAPTPVA